MTIYNIRNSIFVDIYYMMQIEYIRLLENLPPISLDEMSAVRLMNRTDIKFIASEAQLKDLLSKAQDDYIVQDIEGKRYVEYSTVYLDDTDNTMYLNHHNGRLTRQKVRVRTYVDTNDSFFEVKLKNNHGRTKKKRIPVNGMETIKEDGASEFLERCAFLPIPLNDMFPNIANHFERITLINKAKTERLTIDSGLSFHNVVTGIEKEMKNLIIIEVKKEGNTYSPIMDILRELRIHPSGFSKYCIGMALTTPGIKRNRFNIKIRKIEKIITE